jgi:hypothetical protein
MKNLVFAVEAEELCGSTADRLSARESFFSALERNRVWDTCERAGVHFEVVEVKLNQLWGFGGQVTRGTQLYY